MNRFNRITAVILALILTVVSITSCTGAEKPVDSDKISIITTIFPPYDFAKQIAGEYADVAMLLPPGSESHSYEPSPKDIISIQSCDIFIYGGGESDSWVDGILSDIDTSAVKVIAMMDETEAMQEEISEGMMEEHENGHDSKSDGIYDGYDEHVWTSPKNAEKICEAICRELCLIDEQNSQYYKQSCKEYISKLEQLDLRFEQIVNNAKRKSMVFGDRFPFLYFVKEYGLSYWAAFPGCSSETEASASTIAFLTDKVKNENIPVVFYIEFSNHKIADAIAEAVGAKIMLFHSCHTVSKDELEAGVTYIELMNSNADNLEEALN